MTVQTKTLLVRILAGTVVLVLLFILLIDWPIGLLLLCVAAFATAFINFRNPALLMPLRFRRKKEGEIPTEEKPDNVLSNSFVPTIKLTCRDSSMPIEFTIDKPQFLIGRSRTCNYVLDFSNLIGRQHCVIDYHPDTRQYTIRDNASKHGTKLNGRPLKANISMPLHMNDEITIDQYRFHVTSISYH